MTPADHSDTTSPGPGAGSVTVGEPESGLGEATGPPLVSVIVPMLDEIDWIEACIESFRAQDHPLDRLEVVVVDGGSTDGSRELVEALAARYRWLRLVDNPDRLASAAFNRGIEAARGDVICIVGAHAEVGADFLSRSVGALSETGAGGVGGRLRHDGTDPRQQAIGLAMTSRFGMASPVPLLDTTVRGGHDRSSRLPATCSKRSERSTNRSDATPTTSSTTASVRQDMHSCWIPRSSPCTGHAGP
ncbi:MAG: glycosyltransferase [Microthrixaceae bacterium]|nr:glycosyltransferase [Microthrixaceae bacterium]